MDHRPGCRRDGHAWRRRAGAVLTGIGTRARTTPAWTSAMVPTRDPAPPGADRLPAGALARGAAARSSGPTADLSRAARTGRARSRAPGSRRRAGLDRRPARQGGPERRPARPRRPRRQRTAHRSRLQAQRLAAADGVVNELLVYLAPLLMGEGGRHGRPGHADGVEQAPRYRIVDTALLGGDLRLRLRPGAV
ncbi:hypothetical protein Ddc_24944 [Ditylenchus destructor]|nr:hypothetical protein Ddc_24944 [Ditylenchus destructor]